MTYFSEELLAELLLQEAMKHTRTVAGCSPSPQLPTPPPKAKTVPAPLLVGIETNPGPPRRNTANRDSVAGVSALGALLGAALARRQKKKKISPSTSSSTAMVVRSGRKNNKLIDMPMSTRRVFAPTTFGLQTSRNVKHTPFILSGRAHAVYLRNTTGNLTFGTQSGSSSSTNTINVDPLGNSNTSNNFASFPGTVYAISGRFVRYRFRKLLVHYIPSVPTTELGSLTFASTAEVVSNGATLLTYATIASMENAVSTPVWAPITIDLLANGLRREWLYTDSVNATTQATLRQETAGVFCAGSLGLNAATSGYVGSIQWEYELEYHGIANESELVFRNPDGAPHAPTTIATSSSSTPPIPTPLHVNEEEHGLSESVYLPSSLLNSMGLRRA